MLFQFYGNSTAGYIQSASLFRWWTFQWSNPASETGHGWLVAGLSAWLFWRALRQPKTRPATDPEPAWPAAVAIAAGLLLHLAGFAAQQARVEVKLREAQDNRKVFTGILRHKDSSDGTPAEMFCLEFDIKKNETQTIEFAFDDVEKAKLDPVLDFKGKKR